MVFSLYKLRVYTKRVKANFGIELGDFVITV